MASKKNSGNSKKNKSSLNKKQILESLYGKYKQYSSICGWKITDVDSGGYPTRLSFETSDRRWDLARVKSEKFLNRWRLFKEDDSGVSADTGMEFHIYQPGETLEYVAVRGSHYVFSRILSEMSRITDAAKDILRSIALT